MTRGVPLLRFWLMREASSFMCHMCGRITDTHFYSRHHSIIFSHCVFDKFSSWNLNVFHSMINFIWHHHGSSAHRYLCAIAAHPTRVTTFAFCHTSCPDGPNGGGWEMKKEHPVLCRSGSCPSCSDRKSQRRLANAKFDAMAAQPYDLHGKGDKQTFPSAAHQPLLSGSGFSPGAFYKLWPDERRTLGGGQVSQTRWQLRRA